MTTRRLLLTTPQLWLVLFQATPLTSAFSLNKQQATAKKIQELYDDQGGPYAIIKEYEHVPVDAGVEEDEVDVWYPTVRKRFEFFKGDNNLISSLVIRETSFGCGKLGHCVWPGAEALCLRLIAQPELVQNKRVMELGAGCGLPSRLCQELGASAVLATDFWQDESMNNDTNNNGKANKKEGTPEQMHAINLQYNTQSPIQRVDWKQLETVREAQAIFQPDVILGSDLVYYPANLQPLLDTLEVLLDDEKLGASAAIFMSPLPPDHEREALPDFRRKLPDLLPNHHVDMQELTLFQPDNFENQRFLQTIVTKKR